MKDIHIVFVNYLTRDDLVRALTSLRADLVDSPYQAVISVVDNSTNVDGVKEVIEKDFPEAKYIHSEKNVGFGQANTVGFRSHPARYYFALNPDTIIPEQSRTVERLVRFMDEHPKIGAVGPKLLHLDGSLQYGCSRFDLRSMLIKPLKHLGWDEKFKWLKKYADRLHMKDFHHETTRPVDWVLGAAMVVRHEVTEAIGWFDPRYFMYLEDADWCRSMWGKGWPVYYVHDIVIHHRYARESSRVPGIMKALANNSLARAHLKSWVKYLWKWRGTYRYY